MMGGMRCQGMELQDSAVRYAGRHLMNSMMSDETSKLGDGEDSEVDSGDDDGSGDGDSGNGSFGDDSGNGSFDDDIGNHDSGDEKKYGFFT
jgi:hypothetical protein